MDQQGKTETVQRDPEAVYGAWPKKRTLLINAKSASDFIRAGQLAKCFREDVQKYKQRSGRNHGIIYTSEGYTNPAYVWYTTNQLTIHFEE